MRKLLLLSALCFVASVSLEAQTSKDIKAVESLIQDSFDDLFSDFDSEKVSEYYTDDFILLELGEIWDLKKVTDYFIRAKSNPNQTVRLNKFEFIKTVIDGDRAWTSYWNWATFKQGDEVVRELKWLESATAVKTDKGWRLDMLHSTRVEEEK